MTPDTRQHCEDTRRVKLSKEQTLEYWLFDDIKTVIIYAWNHTDMKCVSRPQRQKNVGIIIFFNAIIVWNKFIYIYFSAAKTTIRDILQ